MKSKLLRKNNGVGLVSVIVTSIVVIIIIVTVIKLVTNGANVLSKAQSAKEETKESGNVEKLSLLLTPYQTEDLSSNSKLDFKSYLEKLKEASEIEDFWLETDLAILKYDESYYLAECEKNNWLVAGSTIFQNEEMVEKTIENYRKSISENLENKIELEDNSVYVISDLVKENVYNYDILYNNEVSLVFLDDYEINNKNKLKSAIELGEDSTLNIYVYNCDVEISSLYNGNSEIIYDNITSKRRFCWNISSCRCKFENFRKWKYKLLWWSCWKRWFLY